ncbi:MAG: cytochrome-c oxidase, cbb3-type subunit III [Pseudorhodobacter sp.]
MSRKPTTKPRDVNTTGHSWDGIEEFDNPMPRWWLWSFYLTIIWAIGYTIAYPAWPLISAATPGLLSHSTRADVAAEIQRFNEANAPMRVRLEEAELTGIANDPELADFSRNAGAAVFRTWCAQCHGSGAAGVQASGYPNLLDDDWIWGGDIENIYYTVTHGVRSDLDDETRYAEMPRFGVDELLDKQQITEVVQHVRAISGQDHDPALAEAGAAVFADNCASCHGDEGEGIRDLGGPRLNDAIWLFGGSVEDITYTVENARAGMMPNWNSRLSEADIRAVAVYVHGLGGGE